MTQKLTDFLLENERKTYAVDMGTAMHAKMQNVVIDTDIENGDSDIIKNIKSKQNLLPFFVKTAQTEVAIAGVLYGRFVSRRIDRLLINHESKTIDFIDYKTDVDKTAFFDRYKHQLKEYAELLRSAYPNYKICGYILWLHDWSIDKIIS